MIIKRKLGPKGQIVLPKDIRDMLGVKPGEDILIEVINDEIKIRSPIKNEEFLSNFYNVPKKLNKKVDIEKIIDEEYTNNNK